MLAMGRKIDGAALALGGVGVAAVVRVTAAVRLVARLLGGDEATRQGGAADVRARARVRLGQGGALPWDEEGRR